MAVAELVPAVAVLERGPVAAVEELLAGGGAQQVEVRRLRLVPAGHEPVDRTETPLGRDYEVRPAGTRDD